MKKPRAPAQAESSESDEPVQDEETLARLKTILGMTQMQSINCVSWAKLKKEADEKRNQAQPLDLSKLLTVSVKCNGKPTDAIIDTGSVVSIMSPELAREYKVTQIP